jgi:hypothetical protein
MFSMPFAKPAIRIRVACKHKKASLSLIEKLAQNSLSAGIEFPFPLIPQTVKATTAKNSC